VERVTYFGHDTLTDVRLTGGQVVRARMFGTDVPGGGDVVRVAVHGAARAYPASGPS